MRTQYVLRSSRTKKGRPVKGALLHLLSTTGLLEDLGNDACSDRPSTLTDSEAEAFVHRDRRNQLDRHLNVVARHHHLHPLRKLDRASHVRRTEVELRAVSLEERR